MTKTAKVIVTIVAVLVVLGGIYWWLMGQNGGYQASTGSNAYGNPTGLSSGNSNSDLNRDLAAIDGQIGVFTADSASIDQSMNDQPVAQSQL